MKETIETSLQHEVEYMLDRVTTLFNKKKIFYDRSVTIQNLLVYTQITFDSLSGRITKEVVVYNGVTGEDIKIGYYTPNLKEKIEAAIRLLQY
jgi:hypothetical protein